MLLYWLINILIKDPLEFVAVFSAMIIPLFFSITVHEFSHGVVAYAFGDNTPKDQGRLTLNPFAHLDPMGTLMLFIVGLGWAKPVIVNPANIKSKTKMMLVAIAGPLSNVLLAVIFSFLIYFIPEGMKFSQTLLGGFFFVIRINIILAIFNMLPIPPLDGSRLISWLLPEKLELIYEKMEPYGIFVLFLLLFTVGFDFMLKIASNIQLSMVKSAGVVLNDFWQFVQ